MLLDAVRQTIRRHDLATPSTRLVIALSGGGDSVALAHLLHDLHNAGELAIAGIAHFNHQLRDHADRDEQFCRSLAGALGHPFLADREDIAARSKRERRSIEVAARNARHEFFVRACTHFSAEFVALGHTRDDQAETFLLRLLRGAGARGLSGMHPRSGHSIRPLLDCGRAELRAFLVERGATFLEDATNADVSIPRNRVRAELLPFLQERFNPAVVETLASQAELARDEWLWMLDELKTRDLEGRRSAAEGTWTLERAALLSSPRAIRRLALWRAMTEAAGGRTVSLEHVNAALRMAESDAPSGCVDAPGHVVERIGDRVVLKNGRSSTLRSGERDLFRYPLSIPGEVSVPQRGCIVSAQFAAAEQLEPLAVRATMSSRATAIVAAEGLSAPLSVRNRRPGDRFRPFGLDGQKKLQDFLVDRKVARADRDRVPLVVDADDRIVWVAGHEIDEAFRVTDVSRAVLILTLRLV